MIVVYPLSLKDQDQALRCAQWIRELEGEGALRKHSVLIVKDHRVTPVIGEAIVSIFESLFGFTGWNEVTTDAWDKWPESCNHMFSIAAREIERRPDKGPWLWMEADAIPLKKGWLDWLSREYYEKAIPAGKVFMGDLVDVENVPVHMSGIGVYPPVVGEHAREAMIAHEIAWDCQAASDILPRFYETKLIEHAWKHPTFADWDSVMREVDMANAVLFHSSKDGSLIERLRERGGQPVSHLAHNQGIASSILAPATNLPAVPVLAEPLQASDVEPGNTTHTRSGEARESTKSEKTLPSGNHKEDSRGGGQNQSADPMRMGNEGDSVMGRAPDVLSGETGAAPVPVSRSQITCDIFIKTYEPDLPWLDYCLKSITKFTQGFRKFIVVYPQELNLHKDGVTTIKVGEQPDGYLWQQVIKLDADQYTDAPYILYIDSDTIFTAPVTPKNYFRNGKILWMMTPWEKVSTPWQPVVEKFLGRPVIYEFMRRHPFVVPRWLLSELRAYCERQHGVNLPSYIMTQPHRSFSEFNVLGSFAYEFFRDEFVWVNTEETPPEDWPELTVMQCWSRGGLTEEIKQKFEEILGGSGPGQPAAEVSSTSTANPVATQPLVLTEENITEMAQHAHDVLSQPPGISVNEAIEVLAKEANRGWFYKKRLEKKLKEAGALPKWKRPRRK